MFILRIFKNLAIIIATAVGTLYIADYNVLGKPIRQHVAEAYKSGLITEGIKDIKTWTGDIFKMGQKIAKDDITAKDKEEMEKLIKNELKDNITKMKEEAEKRK